MVEGLKPIFLNVWYDVRYEQFLFGSSGSRIEFEAQQCFAVQILRGLITELSRRRLLSAVEGDPANHVAENHNFNLNRSCATVD